MRFTRLIAGVATAGLLSTTPILFAAPSQATVDHTASVTLERSSTDPLDYGDETSLTGSVKDETGASVYDGTVTLWAMSSKSPTWVAVTSAEASGFLSFSDIKPASNSAYKVTYTGYAATTTYENNYSAAESAVLALNVKRSVKITLNKLTITGKVKPKYAKKKVIIKRIVGKKLKRFAKVKTNKKSVFKFRAPNKRGFKFAVVIPGDKHYIGWANPYQVYRPVAATSPALRPLG